MLMYVRSLIQPLDLSRHELRWSGTAIGFCASCHLGSQILSFLTLLKKMSSDGLGRGSDFRSPEFQDSGERRPTSLTPDIFLSSRQAVCLKFRTALPHLVMAAEFCLLQIPSHVPEESGKRVRA